jgi:hypothetical protein
MPDLERQAAQLAASLRRLDFSEDEIARRIRNALDRRARRTNETAGPSRARRFDGCASVTTTAGRLGVRRAVVFEWLRVEGWLFRAQDGWRATDEVLRAGWCVMRGARAIRWVQLTPAGVQEINHRLGAARGEADD